MPERDGAVKQGDFTVELLTDALCEEYEVERDRALSDVKAIVESWQKVNVLE